MAGDAVSARTTRRHPRAPWPPPPRPCECRWRELRECVVRSPAAPCFPFRASRGRGLDRSVQRFQRWRDAVHRAYHGVARQAEGVACGSRTAVLRRSCPGHDGSYPVPSLRTTHCRLHHVLAVPSTEQWPCQAPRIGCEALLRIAFGGADSRLAARAPGSQCFAPACRNAAGAPDLACDECGRRWFDRRTGACYECGALVTAEARDEYARALEAFAAERARANGAAGSKHL